MATVYKRTQRKPIPEGAKVVEEKGRGPLTADFRGAKFDDIFAGQVDTNASRWFASQGIGGQSRSRCASRKIGL